jgi:hypothetical protein
VVPKARACFEALEIGDELLAAVDRLDADGGNDVYGECCPLWGGENDLFDVHSLHDLDLLPNLKLVAGTAKGGVIVVPDRVGIFAARGIAVR